MGPGTERQLRGHRAYLLAVVAVALALATAATQGRADGATSPVTVSAVVASATSIAGTTCTSTSPGSQFGTVLPNTKVVTNSDCSVHFGSSNDTAMLRAGQLDGLGSAMYRPPTGPLDTAFDGNAGMPSGSPGNGIVSTALTAGDDRANAVAIQADGKIVAAGRANGSADIAVVRYNEDGTLDTGFNGTGKVVLDFVASEELLDVVVMPDQKILVAGSASDADFSLVRLLANGTVDPDFDGDAAMPGYPGNGRVTTIMGVGTNFGRVADLELLPSGKVVAIGWADVDPGAAVDEDFAIARYNVNGTLDTTYSGDGRHTEPFGAAGDDDRAHSVAVDDSGNMTITGRTLAGAVGRWVVARYLASGAIDTAFDGDVGLPCNPCNGKVIDSITPNSSQAGLTVVDQPDGKVLVSVWEGSLSVAVLRYATDGTRDTSWAGDGLANYVVSPPSTMDEHMALQPDGKLVLAGWKDMDPTAGVRDVPYAMRLTANGALDTTFGTTGYVTYPVQAGQSLGFSMAFAADGSLVIVGSHEETADHNWLVLKLHTERVADYSNLAVAGDTDWATGANMFGACLLSTSGTGVAATWSVDGVCGTTDSAVWKPIPRLTSDTGSKVARRTTSTGANVQANIRFGVRTATDQPPGTYIAPVVFEVVAPDA